MCLLTLSKENKLLASAISVGKFRKRKQILIINIPNRQIETIIEHNMIPNAILFTSVNAIIFDYDENYLFLTPDGIFIAYNKKTLCPNKIYIMKGLLKKSTNIAQINENKFVSLFYKKVIAFSSFVHIPK